jgi:hypothetical protein
MTRYHILRGYGVKGSVASDISGCAVEFVSWLTANGHDPETHREAWEPHRRGPPNGTKYAGRRPADPS